ncbi:hypothetical protein Tco_0812658 [Tanacetum coccineum]
MASFSILERYCSSINQRLPFVHQTFIVSQTLKEAQVDETSRSEPATCEMNPRDVIACSANVNNLHCVTATPKQIRYLIQVDGFANDEVKAI